MSSCASIASATRSIPADRDPLISTTSPGCSNSANLLVAAATSGTRLQSRNVQQSLDNALRQVELAMITERGLPERPWFKHQIYAPGLYTGYGAKTLPGIREAAEASRWEEANREAETLVGVLRAVRAQIDQADKALGRL